MKNLINIAKTLIIGVLIIPTFFVFLYTMVGVLNYLQPAVGA